MMKKLSQIKYAIIHGNVVLNYTIRTRRKDCLHDWLRESGQSWSGDKIDGYRCSRIRVSEEP